MPILEKAPQKTEAKAKSTEEEPVSALGNPLSHSCSFLASRTVQVSGPSTCLLCSPEQSCQYFWRRIQEWLQGMQKEEKSPPNLKTKVSLAVDQSSLHLGSTISPAWGPNGTALEDPMETELQHLAFSLPNPNTSDSTLKFKAPSSPQTIEPAPIPTALLWDRHYPLFLSISRATPIHL